MRWNVLDFRTLERAWHSLSKSSIKRVNLILIFLLYCYGVSITLFRVLSQIEVENL